MSSFIVSKVEFVKAAGIMYGIENTKKFPFRYFMERLYDRFVKCYENNVESVAEQYEENYKCDELKYESIFEEYKKIGAQVWLGEHKDVTKEQLKDCMQKFFSSVLYQIENTDLRIQCAAFFFQCWQQLNENALDVRGWWGSIDI